jgi:hypothetical protein
MKLTTGAGPSTISHVHVAGVESVSPLVVFR